MSTRTTTPLHIIIVVVKNSENTSSLQNDKLFYFKKCLKTEVTFIRDHCMPNGHFLIIQLIRVALFGNRLVFWTWDDLTVRWWDGMVLPGAKWTKMGRSDPCYGAKIVLERRSPLTVNHGAGCFDSFPIGSEFWNGSFCKFAIGIVCYRDLRRALIMAVRRLGKMTVENSCLFLCDMQEKFRPAIKYFPQIVNVAGRMLQVARLLEMPVVVTEQYPKGTALVTFFLKYFAT